MQNFHNFINNNFGSNVTHLSNAYPDTLIAIFHSKRIDFTVLPHFLVNTGPDVVNRNMVNSVYQSVRIPFGDTHVQHRYTEMEYLTIVPINAQGENGFICKNYAIPANWSYIVTKNGGIIRQMYGDSNLWLDELGHSHKGESTHKIRTQG